jgi:hypothetical protein
LAGKQPQLIDAVGLMFGWAVDRVHNKPTTPAAQLKLWPGRGSTLHDGQLTPDRDRTRYSKSVPLTQLRRAIADLCDNRMTRMEGVTIGPRLIPRPPCGNDDAEDDDRHRQQHPVLQRDQSQNQEVVDEPVLHGRPPQKAY